jgi:hypothetical protein
LGLKKLAAVSESSSPNPLIAGGNEMKRMLILAAVVLLIVPASAMAGMTAFMNMDELSSKEMASTTGQAGITLDVNATVASGYGAWEDSDGAAGYLHTGVVSVDFGAQTVAASVLIDACSDGAGNSYIVVKNVGSIALNNTVTVKVGATVDVGRELGNFYSNTTVSALTLKISGH